MELKPWDYGSSCDYPLGLLSVCATHQLLWSTVENPTVAQIFWLCSLPEVLLEFEGTFLEVHPLLPCILHEPWHKLSKYRLQRDENGPILHVCAKPSYAIATLVSTDTAARTVLACWGFPLSSVHKCWKLSCLCENLFSIPGSPKMR